MTDKGYRLSLGVINYSKHNSVNILKYVPSMGDCGMQIILNKGF